MAKKETLVTFDNFFSTSTFVYGSVGIPPYHKDTTQPRKIFQKFYSTTLLVNLFVLITLQGLYVKNIDAPFRAKSEIGADIACGVMCAFKVLWIEYNREKLIAILKKLKDIFPVTDDQIQNRVEVENCRKILSYMRMYAIMGLTTNSIFNTHPLVHSVLNLVTQPGKTFIYRLPYLVWYPFELTSIWEYLLRYAHQVSAAYCSTAYLVAADTLLFCIILQLCMHFDDIRKKLLNLNTATMLDPQKELRQIIERHILVLELSDSVIEIFLAPIFVGFLIASLTLCFLLIQLAFGSVYADVFKFFLFLNFLTGHVLLVCWFGNMLKESSENVLIGAYHHNWIDGDIKYKKTLLMLMMRASKPSVFHAVGFSSITLEVFSKVMSLSYKIFTVFRTMHE